MDEDASRFVHNPYSFGGLVHEVRRESAAQSDPRLQIHPLPLRPQTASSSSSEITGRPSRPHHAHHTHAFSAHPTTATTTPTFRGVALLPMGGCGLCPPRAFRATHSWPPPNSPHPTTTLPIPIQSSSTNYVQSSPLHDGALGWSTSAYSPLEAPFHPATYPSATSPFSCAYEYPTLPPQQHWHTPGYAQIAPRGFGLPAPQRPPYVPPSAPITTPTPAPNWLPSASTTTAITGAPGVAYTVSAHRLSCDVVSSSPFSGFPASSGSALPLSSSASIPSSSSAASSSTPLTIPSPLTTQAPGYPPFGSSGPSESYELQRGSGMPNYPLGKPHEEVRTGNRRFLPNSKCEHVNHWKRVRCKKGMNHLVCRICGVKWKCPIYVPPVGASPQADEEREYEDDADEVGEDPLNDPDS